MKNNNKMNWKEVIALMEKGWTLKTTHGTIEKHFLSKDYEEIHISRRTINALMRRNLIKPKLYEMGSFETIYIFWASE